MGVVKNVKIEKYKEYWDSGVEWIGKVPKHWGVSRLGILLSPVSTRDRTDLPLLSITREKGVILRDIENENENHNFIPDDLSNYKVLMEGQFGMNKMKAWQGSYGISNYDGIVSPAYFIFNLKDEINSKYFHDAIRSKLYISFFGAASDGVRIGQWDLSKERMKQIPFLIPPLKEQTAIAEFLDRKTALIDQAIGIKEKQIELLKERRQIVIHRAVTRGLDPKVKLKDSGVEWIGEVPEGWEVKRLKYLVKFMGGGTPDKAKIQFWTGSIPWVSPKEMKRPNIYDTELHISESALSNTAISTVPKDSILIVVRGMILAHTFPVAINRNPLTINQDMKALLVSENLDTDFLYFYLKGISSYVLSQTTESSHGTKKLETSILKNIIVIFPRLSEQKKIVEYVLLVSEKFKTAIDIEKAQITTLKEYKSTLINSAVTGKIKVC